MKFIVVNEASNTEEGEFLTLNEACTWAMSRYKENKKAYAIKDKQTKEVVSRVGILLG